MSGIRVSSFGLMAVWWTVSGHGCGPWLLAANKTIPVKPIAELVAEEASQADSLVIWKNARSQRTRSKTRRIDEEGKKIFNSADEASGEDLEDYEDCSERGIAADKDEEFCPFTRARPSIVAPAARRKRLAHKPRADPQASEMDLAAELRRQRSNLFRQMSQPLLFYRHSDLGPGTDLDRPQVAGTPMGGSDTHWVARRWADATSGWARLRATLGCSRPPIHHGCSALADHLGGLALAESRRVWRRCVALSGSADLSELLSLI
ncbi:uncharacterized protein A4U43_C09F8260 [Asparagus officinalis]|uniref:Uncharacterized protein n=1 Tax=Asparagus officinalis TaxID=4686 RepID=A0A5P1E7X1_ASPOF|nr:uncharacterized protein A4U43_C09F8260 [Asparagus officinalis]